MSRFCAAVLAWQLILYPALAQTLDLTGAWSWSSPGQGGSDYNTLLLKPDGTFVRVSRASNGWLLRYEGVYNLSVVGRNQVRLQSQVRRWAPGAMCTRMPGMGIGNCGQVPHPPNADIQLTILGPGQMQAGGMMLSRDTNPYLLNANVPAQYVKNEAAPPPIVAPTLHPYRRPTITPYDQSGVHRGMNDFIYGRMRGCNYKASGPDGTYYSGCDR